MSLRRTSTFEVQKLDHNRIHDRLKASLLFKIYKLVQVHVKCVGCKLTYGSENKRKSWK
jgi:hypothetical protein